LSLNDDFGTPLQYLHTSIFFFITRFLAFKQIYKLKEDDFEPKIFQLSKRGNTIAKRNETKIKTRKTRIYKMLT
jgi:hypothetical protein